MKISLEKVNECVANLNGDKGQVSDGYHTFDELYEARCLLFVALIRCNPAIAWRASKNNDGQKWEGWFVCGIQPKAGEQITFHLPERFWGSLNGIETHDINPYFDGHNSHDVLERLQIFISK